MYTLFLFSVVIYSVSVNASPRNASEVQHGKTKNIPAVDALIVRLEHEHWKPDDASCLQATLDMLRGVKNNVLWATWVWDSMQPPMGSLYGVKAHIGNYDQCLQAPWSSVDPGLRSQYCLVNVQSETVKETKELGPFDDADEYYRTPSEVRRYFNEQNIGVCLPAVCSPSSVANISQLMLQLTHLPGGQVTVEPGDCDKAGEAVEYPREFYVIWIVMGLLLLTAVVSTASNNGEASHPLDMITKSFCMKKNYNSLFTVNKDEIKCMNGMRFLTAVTIVVIHEVLYTAMSPNINAIEIDKIMSTRLGRSLNHTEIVVDTFFAMSGLLLIRGLMLGKQKNILFTLVKRYLRLVGPLALTTLYLTSTVMYMNDGPLWKFNEIESEVCKESWWKNMLMVNTDLETLCHGVTWYLSCDFQLAVLATFLFYLFTKNRKLGVTTFVAVAVGVTLHLGMTVYWKKLEIISFPVRAFFLLRNHTDLNYTYLKSHVRAGSYLVGMVMGYIVTTYRPGDHRNVISKKWSRVIVGVALATMSMAVTIPALFQEMPYDPLATAVVVSTERIFWAIAICCIIGVCEYGYIPLVTNLLNWPGFVPLSKLSYCLYLLHPLIMMYQKASARTVQTYTYFSMYINALGVLIVACVASLLMYLILEAPVGNISYAVFSEKPKPHQINGRKTAASNGSSNGHGNGVTKEKSL